MPKRMLKTAQEGQRGARGAGEQARLGAGNACASARVLALSILTAALMGVAGWPPTALEMATSAREANLWLFALLPVVNVATAWLYRNHGLRAQRGNNLVIDSTITGTPIHARMAHVPVLHRHAPGRRIRGPRRAAVQMEGPSRATSQASFAWRGTIAATS